MTIKDKEKSLTITIKDYEFPASNTGENEYNDDANWLILHGVYHNGEETVSFDNACLTTYELQNISAALKLILADVTDSFESDFTDPYFSLFIESLGNEMYSISVSYAMPAEDEEWQEFFVETSLSAAEMKLLSDDVEKDVQRFPAKE